MLICRHCPSSAVSKGLCNSCLRRKYLTLRLDIKNLVTFVECLQNSVDPSEDELYMLLEDILYFWITGKKDCERLVSKIINFTKNRDKDMYVNGYENYTYTHTTSLNDITVHCTEALKEFNDNSIVRYT